MATEITLERFREIYPEFNEVADSDVEYALELAQEIHRCSANAIYALSAHFLALASMQEDGEISTGVVKDVKKSRVGRVATEYISMTDGNVEDSYYNTTPYGQLFLALSNSAKKKFTSRVK